MPVVDPAGDQRPAGLSEMEERVTTLAAVGVRNIEQHNRNIQHAIAEAHASGRRLANRCLIVVVIDELADLMRSRATRSRSRSHGGPWPRRRHPPDPRRSACRLTWSRPSSRPPASRILPRAVEDRLAHHLDSNGAEQLGRGDMLFMPSPRACADPRPHLRAGKRPAGQFLRGECRVTTKRLRRRKNCGPRWGRVREGRRGRRRARIVVQSGQASILPSGGSALGSAAAPRDMMEMDGLVSGRRRKSARSPRRQASLDEVMPS